MGKKASQAPALPEGSEPQQLGMGQPVAAQQPMASDLATPQQVQQNRGMLMKAQQLRQMRGRGGFSGGLAGAMLDKMGPAMAQMQGMDNPSSVAAMAPPQPVAPPPDRAARIQQRQARMAARRLRSAPPVPDVYNGA